VGSSLENLSEFSIVDSRSQSRNFVFQIGNPATKYSHFMGGSSRVAANMTEQRFRHDFPFQENEMAAINAATVSIP